MRDGAEGPRERTDGSDLFDVYDGGEFRPVNDTAAVLGSALLDSSSSIQSVHWIG